MFVMVISVVRLTSRVGMDFITKPTVPAYVIATIVASLVRRQFSVISLPTPTPRVLAVSLPRNAHIQPTVLRIHQRKLVLLHPRHKLPPLLFFWCDFAALSLSCEMELHDCSTCFSTQNTSKGGHPMHGGGRKMGEEEGRKV